MKTVSDEPRTARSYRGTPADSEPVLAVDAVKVVNENVAQDEAAVLLGHALRIKAERRPHHTLLCIGLKLFMFCSVPSR